MSTSKKAGHEASKQLKDPKSTPAQKRVAGSDLAQRPKTGKGKK